MCTPEHGDRVSFINFVPEQLSGRGHRPVLDTCANEAIPRWGKGGLINRLYLQLRPTQYPKMCCFHHGPNRESKPAQLLQSVFVLSGPVCLPSHQHVLSQSVCVCVCDAWCVEGVPQAREACGTCRAFASGSGAAAGHRPWQWRAPAE